MASLRRARVGRRRSGLGDLHCRIGNWRHRHVRLGWRPRGLDRRGDRAPARWLPCPAYEREPGSLHGRPPAVRTRGRHAESGATALVVVDMLNPYEHAEAERLAAGVASVLPGI